MSLRVRYVILREIVTLMGVLEFIALPLGTYLLGAQRVESSVAILTATAVSWYISTKLSYRVHEMLVELQVRKLL